MASIITEFRFLNFARKNITQPALYWTPSIAVCGIDFYQGDLFPFWQNHLIARAFKYEEVRILNIVDNRVLHQEIILKNAGHVRDVGCSPEGAIYVLINQPGMILKLSRADFQTDRK